MKRGFTIIELLVASLLLGMLMTILTMIFNQSSIAWRTGTGSVSDLDDARDNIGRVRYEADNAYIWGDDCLAVLSIWDEEKAASSGKAELRTRAVSAPGVSCSPSEKIEKIRSGLTLSDVSKTGDASSDWSAAGGTGTTTPGDTYTVNVMSGGPKNDIEHYEAIWSYPDDFEL